MTANVVVTTEKKSNVIVVPEGIVALKDGIHFVEVKEADNTTTEREVKTGSVSSLGQIEIVSGLSEGDEVLLKQAQK
jgi:hypothetical protein